MRILLFALTVAVCMKGQPAKLKSTEVDRIFAAFNTHTPGCAVGVAERGMVALRAGYGMADLERGVPVNADTVFESGSVAKQFTAMAILLLAQQGKIEVLLEQVRADGFQIVAEQIAEAELLLGGEILLALEHAPARLLQQRLVSVARQSARFGGTNLIQGLVHLGDDVEAVQNMQGQGTLLADHLQVGLPHIGADKQNPGSHLLAHDGKGPILFPHPSRERGCWHCLGWQ
jgi:hypothetical protein